MAVIGNTVQSVPFITDTFSGNASTVNFTLTRAPAGTASIAVFISGVYQAPTAYSLTGDVITFVSAPASGTNNLVVLHLGNGSATQVPSDGSVTTIKIANGAVTAEKIASGVLPTATANAAFNTANGAFNTANAAVAVNTTQNNSITAAFAAANAATATDTTQNNSITASFSTANGAVAVNTTQNNSITVALNTANAAFISANSAASTGKAIAMAIVFGG
jgi:hypothetical protein